MWNWILQLDRVLRGEATHIDELRSGSVRVPIFGLAVVIDVLGMAYGACMGLFSITGSGSNHAMQIPAAMLKVPALFLLTLIVAFPSLYVFNALVGSRLRFLSMLRLLIAAMAVILAVLSSLGPIVAFFSVSTTSYGFMVLLNVAVFALSGVLGLKFLMQTLHRLSVARCIDQPVVIAESSDESNPPPLPSALDKTDNRPVDPDVRLIFRIWMLVFALVGCQMGWVLRPFIGSPDKPFEWFRSRGGNFFLAVWQILEGMFK